MPATRQAPGGTAMLAGRSVARIGFGAMQLARNGLARETALAILRTAVDRGVDHIDTAQFYGRYNELIREALHPYPAHLVLVTKVGAERGEHDDLVPAQRPEQLRKSVEANLATLGVDSLPVVNLRRLDTPPGIRAEGDSASTSTASSRSSSLCETKARSPRSA
jgi:pyridoxine 4-dehydrogenase